MESSPPRAASTTGPSVGMKRPASLLPAFEPLSSSPSLPRPQKRLARDAGDYPTPVPTSSTHILSSSPPHLPSSRPTLQRSVFTTSERAPLSTVPTLVLPKSGEPLLLGRSSASCHHQLSANRLISRVHVKAAYKPAGNPFDRDRVEIVCTGWNGIKLHCQGKKYDLAKGKTFSSDIKDADVMIDVHDARVLIQWPRNDRKDPCAAESDHVWGENSPERDHQPPRLDIPDSPLKEHHRLVSPVSPSPAVRARLPPSSPLLSPSRIQSTITIYEDKDSPTFVEEDELEKGNPHPSTSQALNSSQHSVLSQSSQSGDDFSDHDEENDPIVHSFGPFGDNILPRMASFRTGDSPVRPRVSRGQLEPLRPVESPSQSLAATAPTKEDKDEHKKVDEQRQAAIASIQNHAANQLAFSRLSSTPFSTIVQHLPASLWKDEKTSAELFTRAEIRAILEDSKCIGEVTREGKDAAGKPLESEFYYIPDFDEDQMRREAVVNDLRKPGLRNCRKQHKQYFWRKPK